MSHLFNVYLTLTTVIRNFTAAVEEVPLLEWDLLVAVRGLVICCRAAIVVTEVEQSACHLCPFPPTPPFSSFIF